MDWKQHVLALFAAALSAGCACAQPVRAFEGLKESYAVSDTVAFAVENPSKSEWLYWIELEREVEGRWYVVYSSLANLRSDMAEPVIQHLQAGQVATVQWTPDADSNFTAIYHRSGAHRYRFVLKQIPSRLVLAGPGAPSKAFEIE